MSVQFTTPAEDQTKTPQLPLSNEFQSVYNGYKSYWILLQSNKPIDSGLVSWYGPNLTIDSDLDGIPDFEERSLPVNLTASVSTRSDVYGVANGGTVTLTREKGQTTGNSVTAFNTGEVFSGSWQLPIIDVSGAYFKDSGGVSLKTESTVFEAGVITGKYRRKTDDQIEFFDIIYTLKSGGNISLNTIAFQRYNKTYRATIQMYDGNLYTSYPDYKDWIIQLTDYTDSDNDGIPDISDATPLGGNPPTVEISKVPLLQFVADYQKYDAIEYSEKLELIQEWKLLKNIDQNTTSGQFVDEDNWIGNRFYRFRLKTGIQRGQVAIAEPVVTSGFLTSVKILYGGSGYKSEPIVKIIGGGGTGARAVAEIFNGSVAIIKVINAGIGYTNNPVVEISAPNDGDSKLGVSYLIKMSITGGAGSTTQVEWKPANSLNSIWTIYTNVTQSRETVALFLDPTNAVNRQFRVSTVSTVPNQDVDGTPKGMVSIPAANFIMGDNRVPQSAPLHYVQISGYAIDKYEISNEIWNQVVTWAQANGYDLELISSQKNNFPINGVSWFQAVKWCNAKSEMNGIPPVYYVNIGFPTTKQVYRIGNKEPMLERYGGYRLPTEAEWEYAARGGNQNDLHPYIDNAFYPAFFNSAMSGYNSPVAVGSYPANSFGVFDMLGNVYEWCWDWYTAYGPELQVNPVGPISGVEKVLRGGNYAVDPSLCIVVRFGAKLSPDTGFGGFRTAITVGQPRFVQTVLWKQPTIDAELTVEVGDRYPLSVSLSSRLEPLVKVLSGPAYLDGNTLVSTGVGDIIVSVSHAGNSMFNPVSQNIVIYVKGSAIIKPDMIAIPSANYKMGSDRSNGSTPVHTVTLRSFNIDKNEVTKELWTEVRNWGFKIGYTDLPLGKSFSGKNQPIHSVSWFDVIKWCNARSENAGIAPAYYLDQGLTKVYKVGVSPVFVKWDTGFRLPTEAEWEYAAKGGLSENLYPWQSDPISNLIGSTNLANYRASGFGSTVAVRSYPPNGYGLYDMAGNVWEWCWDWFGGYSSVIQDNPKGPPTGTQKVIRGGAWAYNYDLMYVSRRNNRYIDSPPQFADECTGFRCALSGN